MATKNDKFDILALSLEEQALVADVISGLTPCDAPEFLTLCQQYDALAQYVECERQGFVQIDREAFQEQIRRRTRNIAPHVIHAIEEKQKKALQFRRFSKVAFAITGLAIAIVSVTNLWFAGNALEVPSSPIMPPIEVSDLYSDMNIDSHDDVLEEILFDYMLIQTPYSSSPYASPATYQFVEEVSDDMILKAATMYYHP